MTTYILDRKVLRAAIQSSKLTTDQFTTAVGMSEEELFSDDCEKMTGAEIVCLFKKIQKVLKIDYVFDMLVEKESKSL